MTTYLSCILIRNVIADCKKLADSPSYGMASLILLGVNPQPGGNSDEFHRIHNVFQGLENALARPRHAIENHIVESAFARADGERE